MVDVLTEHDRVRTHGILAVAESRRTRRGILHRKARGRGIDWLGSRLAALARSVAVGHVVQEREALQVIEVAFREGLQ